MTLYSQETGFDYNKLCFHRLQNRQFLCAKGDSNQKLMYISSCCKKDVVAKNVFPKSVIFCNPHTVGYLFTLITKN